MIDAVRVIVGTGLKFSVAEPIKILTISCRMYDV